MIKRETELKKMEIKPNIIIGEFQADYGLKNIKIDKESILFQTDNYKSYKDKVNLFRFYRFKHIGGSELIYDILISVKYDTKDEKEQTFNLHVLEKNRDVFIPMYTKNIKNNTISNPLSVVISFKDLSHEKNNFIYDVEKSSIEHFVKIKNEKVSIYKSNIEVSEWIYPQMKLNE